MASGDEYDEEMKFEEEELQNDDNEQDNAQLCDIIDKVNNTENDKFIISVNEGGTIIELDSIRPRMMGLKRQTTYRELHISLHEAARNGEENNLKCFLSSMNHLVVKKMVNELDDKQMTPLHYAARYNNVGVALLLLENGAEIDLKGEDGLLALHVAARYRRMVRRGSILSVADETDSPSKTVIEVLISEGACINCKDKYGMTPLHYAAMRGNEMAAKELLKHKHIDIESYDKQWMTPLHLAANYGHYEIVSMLLKKGCCINVHDEELQSPLHKAAAEGHANIVELILNTLENENPDLIKEMTSEKDGHKNTPLHLAVQKKHIDVIKILLKKGAKVNHPGESSVYPLHLAATFGNLEIVQLLIEHDAQLNCLTNQLETPLHKAASFNHKEIINYLLQEGALIECRTNDHFSPLLLAAKEGHIDAMKELLANGANVEAVDRNEKSVVYLLSEENHPEALKTLLEDDSSALELISKGDFYDNSPLHAAAKQGFADVVKVLLDNGADMSNKNEDEETALHLAAEYGHTNIVRLLLKYNKSIVNGEDEECNTALHVAASKGHQKVVKDLLYAGANVESRNCNLWTALDCAACGGWVKTSQILLKAGSPVDPMDKTKTTPLHLASSKGHAKVVEMLLKFGAKIGELDENHNNCLDLAIKENHREVALTILRDKNWKDALNNSSTSEKTGVRQTPIRKLIKYMPDVAEYAFDKFITDNGFSKEHDKYEVYYNYEFLDDMFTTQKKNDFILRGSNESLINSDQNQSIYDEHGRVKAESVLYTNNKNILKLNHPLMLMVTSKRQALLAHPVCLHLLNLKWRTYGRRLYFLNLSVYVLFLFFFTGNILANHPPCPDSTNSTGCCVISNYTDCPHALGNDCKYHYSFSHHFFEHSAKVAIYILVVVHILKELFQLFFSFREKRVQYFNLKNMLEWCCYVSALLFSMDFTECSFLTGVRLQWQWRLGGLTIFMAWMVLVLSVQKLHVLGIYVVMFIDVLNTFAQFFVVFFLFIIAFSLGFYILLQNQNPFETPSESLLKTTVMMIGEMEFDAIFNEPENPVYYKGPTYLLFILFLILMSIIIMNLLVGLAVDDIKRVQEQAVLKRQAMKVEMALSIESILPPWALRQFIVKSQTICPNVPTIRSRILSHIWAQPDILPPNKHFNKSDMERVQEKQDALGRQLSCLQDQLNQLKRQNKNIISILLEVIKHPDEDLEDEN